MIKSLLKNTLYIAIITIFFINFSQAQAQAQTQTQTIANFQTFPDLKLGTDNSFVKEVQKVLNLNKFTIAPAGQPGSQNNETTKFGSLTQKALSDFQTKYKITPAKGYFGTKTKAKFDDVFKNVKVSTLSKGTPVSYGSQTCSSVTYFSITWTFTTPVPCGSFANGEPWVVGPVTIINIDPKTGGGMHNSGSMKPTVSNKLQGYADQFGPLPGWDNSLVYDSSLDISLQLPYKLNSSDMLMTSRGQIDTGHISTINEIAILTALSSIPPEGSFRPGIYGTGPRVVKHNKSQIDWSVLKNLPAVPNTPSQANIEKFMPGLPWFEFDNRWVQSGYGPANNFATNGAGVSYPNVSSFFL